MSTRIRKEKSRKSSVSEMRRNIESQKTRMKQLSEKKQSLIQKESKLRRKIENVERNLRQLYQNSSDCQAFLAKLKLAVAEEGEHKIVFTRVDPFITKNISR
jgi:septal ring factor EnvC (AmiA/AmiB activator)